jgi:hypothetical protein
MGRRAVRIRQTRARALELDGWPTLEPQRNPVGRGSLHVESIRDPFVGRSAPITVPTRQV